MENLTSTPGYNPYIIEQNKVVNKFFFFKDDKIIFTSARGWFGYNRTSDTIYVKDLKKKIKENLTKNENFYIKDKTKSYMCDSFYNVFLYVDGEDINVTFGEPYSKTTEMEVKTYQDVSIKIYNHTFTETQLIKISPTDFGNNVNAMMEELKDKGINITHYDLTLLMREYNLIKK